MHADTELPEAAERPPLDQQRKLLPALHDARRLRRNSLKTERGLGTHGKARERLLWRTNPNGWNVVGADLKIPCFRHREWHLTLHRGR